MHYERCMGWLIGPEIKRQGSYFPGVCIHYMANIERLMPWQIGYAGALIYLTAKLEVVMVSKTSPIYEEAVLRVYRTPQKGLAVIITPVKGRRYQRPVKGLRYQRPVKGLTVIIRDQSKGSVTIRDHAKGSQSLSETSQRAHSHYQRPVKGLTVTIWDQSKGSQSLSETS